MIFAKDGSQRHSEGATLATFLFADLCGFTEYTCRYGDELAADLALDFRDRVLRLAAADGSRLVKSIGDGAMVHCKDAPTAVRLALRILALMRIDGYPPIRIGVDSGPAVSREGDWYGATVNAAARVADLARPGELLMTERMRAVVGDAEGIRMVPRGVRALKGLPDAPCTL